MKIINPATEELIAEIPTDNPEGLEKKYQSLKRAQKDWKQRALSERLSIIAAFTDLLREEKEKLAHDLSLEMGKPITEAGNEIEGALYRIQFFLTESEKWLKETQVNDAKGAKEILSFEPLGVIGNISAWNYPFLVGVNVFIPALIAGNAVFYKPSEYSTLTGLNITRLLHKAGVPQDVFIPAVGDGKVGEALLDLPLDGYCFTGSYQTGQSIAKKVAPKMVPVGLELGGKDPVYVMDDIQDISRVAGLLVEGSFYNNGQSCCAVERIYIHEKVYAPFVEAFVEETKKWAAKMGNPLEKDTMLGSLARPQHMNFLEGQVEDALARGASLLLGGKRREGKGTFFEPTVLVNVHHEMAVMKEESFGPIIGLQKVQNDEEALALMQDTPYGLTAGVYSRSEARARAILDQVEAGNVYWNCCDRVSPYLPWAGRKHSGMGSTLSYLGILNFVRPKGYHLKSL